MAQGSRASAATDTAENIAYASIGNILDYVTVVIPVTLADVEPV